MHALLGGFIGAAIGFYLDASQVSVVVAKFHRYLAAGLPPEPFDIYPLVSKWGHLHLGVVTGGVSLLFVEALAGVISWSTAAWLFAINRTFMTAYFQQDATPIRSFFTRDGLTQLAENMIVVLRWGLWMSPIINSFLRPMGEPTWYNQDGAVRTAMAIVRDATMTPEAFRAWSLQVFIYLLAYDAVRILIWLDHMGLRVATLVNLSFLGVDKLEQRLARLLAPAATARCIPEGVKRFTTWGPLLIPYYIPRGKDWDQAWSTAEAIRSHSQGGFLSALVALPLREQLFLLAGSVIAATGASAAIRALMARLGSPSLRTLSVSHAEYEVTLREDGAVTSRVPSRDYDVSRRSYDFMDPAGRALFLVDVTDEARRGAAVLAAGRQHPGRTGRAVAVRAGRALFADQQHRQRAADDHRDLPAGDQRCGGALDDHRREPVELCASDQGGALPGMGAQQPGGRPESYPVQSAVRRDRVRPWAAGTPGLGQALPGHGAARLGSRPGRVPVFADRFHRPRPEPQVAPGAGDPGVLGGPGHPRAPDLRPDRQPAHRHDRARARVVPTPPLDGPGQG